MGNDYPTPDGTGVRDYLHVMDLADAHLKVVEYAAARTGAEALNLGTGRGYSVMEMARAFEAASGRAVPCEIVGRRDGDVPTLVANPALGKKRLGWSTKYGIERMCEDAWIWPWRPARRLQSRVKTDRERAR